MKRGHFLVAALVAALTLVLSACGGPTAPSASGVTLRGVALGDSAQAATQLTAQSGPSAQSKGSPITVTVVEDPSLSTTISGNGTFELNGLPAGTITLVFTRDGVTIGTVTISDIPEDSEVNLVVKVADDQVVMVKIEIDGEDETQEQADQQADPNCLIAGGKVGAGIQLEGSISSPTSSAGPSSFAMTVSGQRSGAEVSVDYSGASFSCAGVKGTCDASLIQTGQKVHVGGNLTSCSLSEAVVAASKVKFQH